MKRIALATLIGWSLIASHETARAQAEELPTPQPPYIEPVPDYGHWMVTFKYPAAKAPASAPSPATPAASETKATAPVTEAASPAAETTASESPKTIETIKTGDLRGVTLTFPSGKSQQFTCQGNWVLCSTPTGPQLFVASPTAIPYEFYTTGYIMLDGAKVDESTFRGAEKHNGIMTFHYKSGDVDVWINPTSLLPLAAKASGVEATFQFLTPPPRPFPIPKDQAGLLQKEQEAYKTTRDMR